MKEIFKIKKMTGCTLNQAIKFEHDFYTMPVKMQTCVMKRMESLDFRNAAEIKVIKCFNRFDWCYNIVVARVRKVLASGYVLYDHTKYCFDSDVDRMSVETF